MKKVITTLTCFILIFLLTGCLEIEDLEDNFSYEVTNAYLGDYGIGYYIEGTVTNNNDRDYYYVEIEFICYDANGNNLGTVSDNTTSLLARQTWIFKGISWFSDEQNVDHCDFNKIYSR